MHKIMIEVNEICLQVLTDSRFRIEGSSESSSLVISETRPEDSGRYTLVARDRKGSAQHSLTLSVIGKLRPRCTSDLSSGNCSYYSESTVVLYGFYIAEGVE